MPESIKKNLHYWLVRHAPINAFDEYGMPTTNRFIGQLDIACDLFDEKKLKWLIAKLPADASLLTSHLLRAKQTTDRLIDAGLKISERHEDSAFAEQNFGDWQGMDYDSHYQHHRDYWHDVINNIPPNGENFKQVCQRVNHTMMLHFSKTNGHQHIIIIAHAGSIRAAIADCQQQTPATSLQYNIAPLSLTHLHFYQTNDDADVMKQVIAINEGITAS